MAVTSPSHGSALAYWYPMVVILGELAGLVWEGCETFQSFNCKYCNSPLYQWHCSSLLYMTHNIYQIHLVGQACWSGGCISQSRIDG